MEQTIEQFLNGRMIRRVICAACKRGDLTIAGPRHFDSVMCSQILALSPESKPKSHEWEQGFIDQYGVFMDREEAMKVAISAGQPVDIKYGCGGDGKTLYSEGLY